MHSKNLFRPLYREALDPNFAVAGADTSLQWHNALNFTIEGRGWSDSMLVAPFDRLPAKAEPLVRKEVWELSRHSSGIYVSFETDASEISAEWTVTNPNLAMNHMPATGVSGLDLYVKDKGEWKWLGVARPVKSPTNSLQLASGIPSVAGVLKEYRLYLPLYNGVSGLTIGIPKSAIIKSLPLSKSKSVLFYGTSITQGGCASRPGMSYTSILGRMLNLSVVNLGFSGNGQAEKEVAELISELNPDIYVLDPIPNVNPSQIEDRLPDFVRTLRYFHPDTPILLIESIIPTFDHMQDGSRSDHRLRNEALRKVAAELMKEFTAIYYLGGDKLLGKDTEGTVDGIHPNDLGFFRIAEVVKPELKKILSKLK
ncbi:MAG: SGNH/GDSL hydrolase family protein [Fibrobacteres bacterium]|nr:SGNH/GDSL hydrolase family protein [Fibrobacterota bacterium]